MNSLVKLVKTESHYSDIRRIAA